MNLAVIGSMFGDEGKGITTDFFSSFVGERGYVVRFNGSAQAGHRVCHPDGSEHIFHHFGSGTLNRTPTFLSKFFVAQPIIFKREHQELLNYSPKVFIDSRSLVITPYDMLLNEARELSRGDKKHGSVGIGFNESIKRSLEFLSLTINDFFNKKKFKERLIKIRDEYTIPILKKLGQKEQLGYAENENILENFLNDCEYFLEYVQVVENYKNIDRNKSFIFEGAQGLMLDEDFGYFPNVTRSRTGTNNVVKLSRELGITIDDVYYIARAYLTRHGRGILPFECQKDDISKNIYDKTNMFHPFQEHLRFAPFNFDLLDYALGKDQQPHIKSSLVITCLDQMESEMPIISHSEETVVKPEQFLDMCKRYNLAFASFGETHKTMERVFKKAA